MNAHTSIPKQLNNALTFRLPIKRIKFHNKFTIPAVRKAGHLTEKQKWLANTLQEYSPDSQSNACLKVVFMLIRWPAFFRRV